MTARPNPSDFALDAFLHQQESKSLLRFIVCGSVDHGKSTLIGRLLYEAKLLFDDQLDTLKTDSYKHGTQGRDLDFSLLLDGLAAEREQKITIDIAYRFFNTECRKFIVADAPGHEQYTGNMATGASTADLALILVSAGTGLTQQTKRHSLIVSTFGVRQIVVAINKMDLVGWSEAAFRKTEAEFRALAKDLDISEIVCIPTAARSGDNVVSRSQNMDWYRGPTLLEYLEQVNAAPMSRQRPFRMPIQSVNRPDADFRGYSGLIAGGELYPGMPVQVSPSGRTSSIERIVTFDGDLDRACGNQSVTLTFKDEIDASRGDIVSGIGKPPAIANRVSARIFWMGQEALISGRSYLLKLGTSTASAKVEAGLCTLDLDTRQSVASGRIAPNEIGDCVLALDRWIAVDRYADCKATGVFILIDRETYDTVGMGIVTAAGAQRSVFAALRRRIKLPKWLARWWLAQSSEGHLRSVTKAVSWRGTGSLDTFIVTYFITSSSVFAGSVAITEIVTKIALYYFHERIWSMVRWGKA